MKTYTVDTIPQDMCDAEGNVIEYVLADVARRLLDALKWTVAQWENGNYSPEWMLENSGAREAIAAAEAE